MDNRIIDVLRQIRVAYDEDVFYNPRLAKNLMNDLCRDMPLERIQAQNFIEMNGYFALKNAGGTFPVVRSKLVEKYKSIYRVDDLTANWIVDVFSAVLGYVSEDVPVAPEQTLEPKQSKEQNLLGGYKQQTAAHDVRVVKKPQQQPMLAKTRTRDMIMPAVFTDFAQQAAALVPLTKKIKYARHHIAADFHTVAIKQDGTVVAAGYNNAGQCNVWHWFDVVSVAAGNGFTVALRSNGTVVATGRNEYGQCNVGRWDNIVALAAGARHTLGLRSDGTVLAAGENKYGECNVSSWRNITAIFAGNQCTYAIKKDRKVIARGYNKNMDYDTSLLTGAIEIADANPHGALALRSDGTVVKARQQMKGDFSRLHSLYAIAATPDCFVGLLNNGTVRIIAYYWESSGIECSPNEWADVCEIAAGRYHIVGLKRDGTVFAEMLHSNKKLDRGQCSVKDWSDIKVKV